MNRYDENYSAYFGAPSEEYPSGSAVDSSSEDNLDGTPLLAKFFNDVIGFMGAAFYGVFGNPRKSGDTVTREVSNEPDNAKRSDVWDAIKKFVTDKVDSVKTALDAFAATKGQAGGFAPLDDSGLVSAQYLPSYVDDVLEFENAAAFPAKGEKGKIYIALDTSKGYRWGGSGYVELSRYDDATETASGLMSAADKKKLDGVQAGAQVNSVTSVSGRTGAVTIAQILSDMAVMGGASSSVGGAKGLVPRPPAGAQGSFLRGDGSWATPSSVISEMGTDYIKFTNGVKAEWSTHIRPSSAEISKISFTVGFTQTPVFLVNVFDYGRAEHQANLAIQDVTYKGATVDTSKGYDYKYPFGWLAIGV